MGSSAERPASEGAVPGPVRRSAGDYLSTELLVQLLDPLPAAFLGVGVLLGGAIVQFSVPGAAVMIGIATLIWALLSWP